MSLPPSYQRRLSAVIGSGVLLAALLVLTAPPLPVWGERHTPHLHLPPLTLESSSAPEQKPPPAPDSSSVLEQTFHFEWPILDRVVLWVGGATALPSDGGINLEVRGPSGTRTGTTTFADIPGSGVAVFRLTPPLREHSRAEGTLRITLTNPHQKVAVQYQAASGIFAGGTLRLDGKEHRGDLAFQLRYQRPALGTTARQGVAAAALVIAGGVVAWLIRRSTAPPDQPPPGARRDVLLALLSGLVVTALYGWFLLHPGFWIGPTDFSKDAAYLASAADALRAGAWPTWSHLTCGGMALLGNPEGNTISLGTLLALVLPPDRALATLLALEAGLATTGTLVLARALGLSRGAAIGAAAVGSLSATFAYRIGEGLTPIGGAVAFLPWTILTFARGLRSSSGWWSLLGGTLLAAMFLRGDVHVVVGTWLVLGTIALILAAKARSARPLLWMSGATAAFALVSSLKVLPYLEQPQLVAADLPPYSVSLMRAGLVDDVFLRLHPRTLQVPVLHGQNPEAWGNFGAFVGTVTLVLAGIGLFVRSPWRPLLLAGAVVTFLVSEGTLFENVLRHIGPLGSLLRVPSRGFSMLVVFLGLLAGLGWDRVRRDLQRSRWSRTVAWLLLGSMIGELAVGAGAVLSQNVWDITPTPLVADEPTLVAHGNRTHADPHAERHSTKLLRAGFLLPRLCGDQNNPPPFITGLPASAPLADVPAQLFPNRILLETTDAPADLVIRTRFTSSWQPSQGTLVENPDGAIHLVLPRTAEPTTTLVAQSATAAAQKVLLLLLLGVGLCSLWGWRRGSPQDPDTKPPPGRAPLRHPAESRSDSAGTPALRIREANPMGTRGERTLD